MYTTLGQTPGVAATIHPEAAGYTNTLARIAAYIEGTLIPQARATVATWESQARAAGVHEANVIAYLKAFNVWEQATAELAGTTIPLEIQRMQQPTLQPLGNVADYNPTPPPAPPAVASLVTAQGGARTGAAQYTGAIVPVATPTVTLPTAVAAAPLSQPLTSALVNAGQALPRPSAGPSLMSAGGGGQLVTFDEDGTATAEPGSGPGGVSPVLLGLGALVALVVLARRRR